MLFNPSSPIPLKSVAGLLPWKPISCHCLVILSPSSVPGISSSHNYRNRIALSPGDQPHSWQVRMASNHIPLPDKIALGQLTYLLEQLFMAGVVH